MKKTIVALLVGILLGSTGMATAAGIYWERGGNSYRCEGVGSGVACREINHRPAYKVYITPGYVSATYGNRPIFGCKRGYTPGNAACVYNP